MPAAIPDRLPACFLDAANDNMSTVWRPQIHAHLDFAEKPDLDRLAHAMRLLADAEPVLGARWVRGFFRAHWRRLDATALDVVPWLIRSHDYAEPEFLARELDATRGPQLFSIAFAHNGGWRLTLKINHMVVDAGGTKAYLYQLADTYRQLGRHAGYRPEVNRGERGMPQVYGRLGLRTWWRLLVRHVADMRANLKPYQSVSVPLGQRIGGAPQFRFLRFDAEQVQCFRAYAARFGATLNDLFATAMLRAIARVTDWQADTSALRMIGTVDLRRYMPARQAQALCNLSGFFFTRLGTTLEADFEQTLLRAKACHDAQKAELFGLPMNFASWLLLLPYPLAVKRAISRKLFHHMAVSGNMMPGMTNLGPIAPARLDFGGPKLLAAELIVPPAMPPFFFTGLSGFGDTLCVSAGFFESAIGAPFIQSLFATLKDELPG